MNLRPYQTASLNAVTTNLHSTPVFNRLLIKKPTGTGKTVTFAALLRHLEPWLSDFPERQRRMLVIAHREELLDQAAEKIRAANPGLLVCVEQGDRRTSIHADVVVASIQTLAAMQFRRLRRLLTHGMVFRVVVVDEAHHAAASSYRVALSHLGFLPPVEPDAEGDLTPPSYADVESMQRDLREWDRVSPKDRLLVGVTATPNRTDAIGLGCVFQTIAYSYDLRKAIEDNWLVPIRALAIETDTSLDAVRTSRGDFQQNQLAEAVNTPERNRLTVTAWQEHAAGRPTLAFSVDVAHAHALAKEYQDRGVDAYAISGDTPKDDRRALLRAYSTGDIPVLTNCMVLTEGTDLPRTSCILHAKPTKSATLFEQMCLDSETEILTEQGWAGIDTDIAGVKVAAFSLDDSSVVWSDATRIERPRGGERMWGIESPHLNIRVTGGHRMVIQTRGRKTWHISPAEDMPAEVTIPVCGVQHVPDVDITDDEIAFLGLLLTDGSLSAANQGISLFQSDRYPAIVDFIDRTLKAIGVKYTRSAHQKPSNFGPRRYPLNRWTVSRGAPRGRDAHLRGWDALSSWVSPTAKTLTPAYERLSARQVWLLLEAMHAGDGIKRAPDAWTAGSMSICANPVLADQVQSLCVRRGFRCNVSPRTDSLVMLHISQHRPDWTMVRHADDGRPTWAVVESASDERVWCVSVSTGAIITRRHGKVSVVGNTGRGLRLFPGKADCLVIDVVDIARKHSLMTTPMLYGLPPGLVVEDEVDLETFDDAFAKLRDEFPSVDFADALTGERLTLAELRAKAVSVDIWKVRELAPEFVASGRLLRWLRTADDAYTVSYPWDDHTGAFYETIVVQQNLVGQWDITHRVRAIGGSHTHEQPIITGLRTAGEAAQVAEGWMRQHRTSVTRMKAADAGWMRKPATPAQLALLRRLKVPFDLGLTSGRASELIDMAKVRRAR